MLVSVAEQTDLSLRYGSFMQTKNLYVWSTSELRVRLAPHETGLSPPVKYFYRPIQGGPSFVHH